MKNIVINSAPQPVSIEVQPNDASVRAVVPGSPTPKDQEYGNPKVSEIIVESINTKI